MKFHLVDKSRNVKIGPIPVSTSSADTCPDACPLKGAGCYADGGPLALHWRAVTGGERGASWAAFLKANRFAPGRAVLAAQPSR